jgi:hypothetical protein
MIKEMYKGLRGCAWFIAVIGVLMQATERPDSAFQASLQVAKFNGPRRKSVVDALRIAVV